MKGTILKTSGSRQRSHCMKTIISTGWRPMWYVRNRIHINKCWFARLKESTRIRAYQHVSMALRPTWYEHFRANENQRCWFVQTERINTIDSFDPTEAWAYERCWFVRTERINAVGSFRLNQGAHTLYLPFEGGDAGRRHECQWTRVITGGRGNTAPEHPVIIGRAYVLPHRHHRAPNIYHSSFPQPGSQVFCDTLVDVLSSTFIHHHERRIILPVHCDGASTSSSVGAVYRRVVSFRTT